MSTLPLQPSPEPCPVCGRFKISCAVVNPLLYIVKCHLCGQYSISGRLFAGLSRTLPNFILSGIIRNYWEMQQEELELSCEKFESLEAFVSKSPIQVPRETDIPAKADLVLKHIQRRTEFPGSMVEVNTEMDFSIGFCRTATELSYLLRYLESQNHIDITQITNYSDPVRRCTILPEGWAYLSGIGTAPKDQGFIAMAFSLGFSDRLRDEGLLPGIEQAGYYPQRIDRKEHNNRIDDEIVAEIRKSKFVVADLTGKNAGAYFEAGFAMGLGKPVIWTCQQSEIDSGNVHFDTRQYSIVPWEPDKLDDFAKRLTQRIEATIGRGTYVFGVSL